MSSSTHAATRNAMARAACALIAMLLLSGCGRGAVGDTSGTPGTLDTPTAATNPPAPSSPLGAPGVTCNQLPGMSRASFVQIDYLDFPEDGVGTGTITSPNGAPMEVDEYNLCLHSKSAPNTDPDPMKTVLTAINVSGRGWTSGTAFPFDGTTPRPCTPGQVCFSILEQGYLLVENVRVYTGKLYTFHLRRALPAPLVRCDPALFPNDTYPTTISPEWAAEIPLPLVTRVSSGEDYGQGITTYLCSAGTPASIMAFMNQQLPKYGWEKETVAGKQLWKTTDSTPTLHIQVYAVTNPRQWAILEYDPNFNI